MVRMDDYKTESGSIDWKSYREAQVQAGERCVDCGAYMFSFRASEGARSCNECRDLLATAKVNHSRYVRCPKCGHKFNPSESECYELYEEGEHEVFCDECEHDFTISTHVSYNFESPAMEGEDNEGLGS